MCPNQACILSQAVKNQFILYLEVLEIKDLKALHATNWFNPFNINPFNMNFPLIFKSKCKLGSKSQNVMKLLKNWQMHLHFATPQALRQDLVWAVSFQNTTMTSNMIIDTTQVYPKAE